jgi:hypothetical protein
MKPRKHYRKGTRVLVSSFAGTDVCVTLQKRYIATNTEHKLGVDGWYAQITNQKEVDKLRRHGVPYKKGEKPKVWVFDWQIIEKCN